MKKQIFTIAFALCAAFGYSQNSPTWPSTGNVGIGTASPNVKLDVVTGSSVLNTNLGFFGYRHASSSANPSTGLFMRYEYHPGATIPPVTTKSFKLLSVEDDVSSGYVAFNPRATANTTRAAVTIGYGTTEFMRVNQDGKVRIASGATDLKTSGNYKLFVETGILTEKVKVAVKTTTDWADYVFASDYQLMPLTEVEAFTKENGHLPNVPSADEMVTEGLDVAKMDAKLLEKVEELTLYLIEQQKQIDALKAELEAVKQQKQ